MITEQVFGSFLIALSDSGAIGGKRAARGYEALDVLYALQGKEALWAIKNRMTEMYPKYTEPVYDWMWRHDNPGWSKGIL